MQARFASINTLLKSPADRQVCHSMASPASCSQGHGQVGHRTFGFSNHREKGPQKPNLGTFQTSFREFSQTHLWVHLQLCGHQNTKSSHEVLATERGLDIIHTPDDSLELHSAQLSKWRLAPSGYKKMHPLLRLPYFRVKL